MVKIFSFFAGLGVALFGIVGFGAQETEKEKAEKHIAYLRVLIKQYEAINDFEACAKIRDEISRTESFIQNQPE